MKVKYSLIPVAGGHTFFVGDYLKVEEETVRLVLYSDVYDILIVRQLGIFEKLYVKIIGEWVRRL